MEISRDYLLSQSRSLYQLGNLAMEEACDRAYFECRMDQNLDSKPKFEKKNDRKKTWCKMDQQSFSEMKET